MLHMVINMYQLVMVAYQHTIVEIGLFVYSVFQQEAHLIHAFLRILFENIEYFKYFKVDSKPLYQPTII